MKRSIRMIVIAISLGFVTVVPCIALAQDQPASNMEIVREKLRADKKLLIAQAMGLTEREATNFWPLYEIYQKDLIKLADREIELIKEYARVYKSMTNEEAAKLMNEFLDIEGDYQQTRREYVPKFRGVLSDIKVARYFQIENKINALVDFELAEKIPLIGE
jgi:hypothetical protein